MYTAGWRNTQNLLEHDNRYVELQLGPGSAETKPFVGVDTRQNPQMAEGDLIWSSGSFRSSASRFCGRGFRRLFLDTFCHISLVQMGQVRSETQLCALAFLVWDYCAVSRKHLSVLRAILDGMPHWPHGIIWAGHW